jgi:ATP-dependent helicase/nuclease subunit A
VADRDLTTSQEAALDVARSVAVTAGAGSGKTTVLIERYLRVLDRLGAEPREVLAITFTQKAAAEMRARLVARLGAAGGDGGRRRRDLASAPISTIHSFCGEVLREFALEAGVDPAFEVLEAVEQRALLRETVDDLLSERAGAGDASLRGLAAVLGRREIADALLDLAGRRTSERWARALLAESDAGLLARWDALPGALDAARALDDPALASDLATVREAAASGVPASDPLATAARALAAARPASRRDLAALGLLTARLEARSFGNRGSKKAWGKTGLALLQATREALARIAARVARAVRFGARDLDAASIGPLRALASLFVGVFERYRARKDARSLLDFDDLVARAAALLEDPGRPGPREALRRRFRAVLVDEFQDVDPTQWAVIESIVTDGARRIAPERLFVVGDEKQSIYRFRGADVSIFRAVRERVDEIALADGFRSLPALTGWVNGTFDRIFGAGAAPWEARPGPLEARRAPSEGEGPGDVAWVVLPKPARGGGDEEGAEGEDEEVDEGDRPAAAGGGEDAREGAAGAGERAAESSGPEREARVVARLALREIERGRRPSDVAILLRRRTHLKRYEEALRRLGLPFVVHGGAGFYGAQEVLDALGLLAFLADPRDDIALLGVLRSPFASLADGTISLVASLRDAPAAPEGGAPPATLAEALALAARDPSPLDGLLEEEERSALRRAGRLLASLAREADRRPAAESLRRALDESGARAAYAASARGPQAAANLEKLLETARRFEVEGLRGLPRLADMLGALADEGEAAEAEAEVSLEGEGVRILTVHASKGLEFPVVIVPECGARLDADAPPVTVEEIAPGAPEVALAVPDPLLGWARGRSRLGALLAERLKAKADAEMRRLFYVACTRAEDSLLLVGEGGRDASWLGWARAAGVPPHRELDGLAVLAEDAPGRRVVTPEAGGPEPPPSAPSAAAPALAPIPAPPLSARITPSLWTAFRRDPRAYYRRHVLGLPEVLAASPAPGVSGEGTADAPARDGSAAPGAGPAGGGDAEMRRVTGVVVHRLLEPARPADDEADRREAARILADEGLAGEGRVEAVLAAARAAREAVRRSEVGASIARASRRIAERPIALALPEGVVEGRIDLAIEEGGRWRVVDWKTDAVGPGEAGPAARRRGYLDQLSAYALALSRVVGAPEVTATVFFTTPGVAVDLRLDAAALREVEGRLRRDLAAIAALGESGSEGEGA